MEILLYALIAGFILFRLYNSLGKIDENDILKTQNEFNQTIDIEALEDELEKENSGESEFDLSKIVQEYNLENIKKDIENVKKIYPNFGIKKFIEGAEKAFSLVMKDFFNNHTDYIKMLCNEEIFKKFATKIEERKNETVKTIYKLVAINNIYIKNIDFGASAMYISILFNSEQLSYKETDNNEDSKELSTGYKKINVSETWKFEKKLNTVHENDAWLLYQIS